MKVCLAAPHCRPYNIDTWMKSPALLESFAYWQDWEAPLVKGRFFMFDSGAFSFMQGRSMEDLDGYLDAYIAHVNRHRPSEYFELDLDCMMDYSRVKAMTRRMEDECFQPPIPVWHVSRGKAEFVRLCKRYDYVAVGGIVSGEANIAPFLPWFIDTAHAHGAKIHGLGFVRASLLDRYHFDSVDSRGWQSHQYGNVAYFDGRRIVNRRYGEGYRGDYKGLTTQAVTEWIKFQKYAEVNL